VSFVRQIDPFDKYFSFKKTLKVRDFVNKDIVIISEDETLMEIMFLITVKKATVFMWPGKQAGRGRGPFQHTP
jgi:predicted transcriptional regulator